MKVYLAPNPKTDYNKNYPLEQFKKLSYVEFMNNYFYKDFDLINNGDDLIAFPKYINV